MNIPTELVRRIEDKVLAGYQILQDKYKQNFSVCDISFDLNSGRIAGQASILSNRIKINPRFLLSSPENQNYILDQTIFHEIAHLATHKLFPFAKQHHGPEWKSIAISLGIAPHRCHQMELPEMAEKRKLNKRFLYRCPCQEIKVSRIIHFRIQCGGVYTCRKCRNRLIFIEEIKQ